QVKKVCIFVIPVLATKGGRSQLIEAPQRQLQHGYSFWTAPRGLSSFISSFIVSSPYFKV
ncbi:hypothetical protein AMECASPLE_022780, partial [Ameca splendens]